MWTLLRVSRTVSLLLHGPRLRHGETLHNLVLLPSLLVFGVHFVWWPLQHATIKRVAVPAGLFLWPRHSVYWTHTNEERRYYELIRQEDYLYVTNNKFNGDGYYNKINKDSNMVQPCHILYTVIFCSYTKLLGPHCSLQFLLQGWSKHLKTLQKSHLFTLFSLLTIARTHIQIILQAFC